VKGKKKDNSEQAQKCRNRAKIYCAAVPKEEKKEDRSRIYLSTKKGGIDLTEPAIEKFEDDSCYGGSKPTWRRIQNGIKVVAAGVSVGRMPWR